MRRAALTETDKASGGSRDENESRQRRERQLSQEEILLWRSPEGIPKASRASECNALLSLTRAVCVIAAQRQPGKFGREKHRLVLVRAVHLRGERACSS